MLWVLWSPGHYHVHCIFTLNSFTGTNCTCWWPGAISYWNTYRYRDGQVQVPCIYVYIHMGGVTELQLSCYLVLLSSDSKTRLTRQPQFRDLTHIHTGLPHHNRPLLQAPQCTCLISHNAPFRTEIWIFLFWIVHCGIWDRFIVGLWISQGCFYSKGLTKLTLNLWHWWLITSA